MFELFREMNWTLIGTLIAVSALVAWAGDIVGMKLGKKRITFMKLRPKYTSRIISVLTGVGIALATMLVISMTSETVRTALFSMRYVQSQITSLTAELQKNRQSLQGMEFELFQNRGDLQLKQNELLAVEKELAEGAANLDEARRELSEMRVLRDRAAEEQTKLDAENKRLLKESGELQTSVQALRKESEELKEGIQKLREGRITVFTGEVLSQGVTNETMTRPQYIDQAIESLTEGARARLAYKFGKQPYEIPRPQVEKETVDIAKKEVLASPGRYLLRLTAGANAVEDEPVIAELELHNTSLIFKKDTLLAEKRFEPGETPEQLEDEVFRVLREVNARASREGVLRDPITGNVGSIDSAAFVDVTERLAESTQSMRLQIYAAEDIYTEGPVRIRFELK